MIKLSLACFILFFGGLVADNVPVFIWGPFDHYTPASALKSYDGDEFIDVLSQHITPETFALVIAEDQIIEFCINATWQIAYGIVQPEGHIYVTDSATIAIANADQRNDKLLSTEDLSQCRTSNGQTCFQGIQQIKSKLYLPSVEDPVPIIDDVAGLDKTEVTLSSSGALSEPINAEGGKYVFINFEDDASDESKFTKLAQHDQLIKKLLDNLSSQNLKLIVIYTGKRSEHQKRIVRQVAQQTTAAASNSSSSTTSQPATAASTSSTAKTADVPVAQPKQENAEAPVFFQRSRLLLYYTSLYQVIPGNLAIDVTNITLNEDDALHIFVTMEAGSNTLEFNITDELGYFHIRQISWNNRPLTLDTPIYALDKFSFHCTPPIELATSNRDVVLTWSGLQFQPRFTVVAGQEFNTFDDSYDCVGFVSPGIVGGLFVVIMLLFILSIGISFMMDINTMDRFDDPKGKTIIINVNE